MVNEPRRKFPPLPPGHPSIDELCWICRRPLKAGDETTLVGVRPASEEDHAKMLVGEAYTAEAQVVHWSCWVKG